MPLILHKMDISSPSRTVLAVAEILGLSIESRDVNILEGDQWKPDFLEKNPLHRIPLLEDGDLVLADSHAIIIYLVLKYGSDKTNDLYPNSLAERAIIHQRLFMDASILFQRLYEVAKPIFYENATSVDERKAADVEEAYGFLDKYLQRSLFIAADRMTLADISCVTTVSALSIFVPITDKFAQLKEWYNKLSNQDWFINKNKPGLKQFSEVIDAYLNKNATRDNF